MRKADGNRASVPDTLVADTATELRFGVLHELIAGYERP